jgi:hypothetical protein
MDGITMHPVPASEAIQARSVWGGVKLNTIVEDPEGTVTFWNTAELWLTDSVVPSTEALHPFM